MDLFKFEANLVYKVSSRTARATQRNPVSKINKQTDKTKNEKQNNSNNNKEIQYVVWGAQEDPRV